MALPPDSMYTAFKGFLHLNSLLDIAVLHFLKLPKSLHLLIWEVGWARIQQNSEFGGTLKFANFLAKFFFNSQVYYFLNYFGCTIGCQIVGKVSLNLFSLPHF